MSPFADTRLVLAATLFALVATITPGPNNLILAASGLNVGFRRTLPTMFGFQCGLLLLLLAVASGLGAAFVRSPSLHMGLKLAGAAYLLVLAYRLWRSSAIGGDSAAPPLGFFRGAAFQAVNPKAWMMCTSAVSAYSLPGAAYWPSIGILLVAFTAMGLPSVALWTAFGGAFRSSLGDARIARRLRRTLAALTALSCLLIFL